MWCVVSPSIFIEIPEIGIYRMEIASHSLFTSSLITMKADKFVTKQTWASTFTTIYLKWYSFVACSRFRSLSPCVFLSLHLFLLSRNRTIINGGREQTIVIHTKQLEVLMNNNIHSRNVYSWLCRSIGTEHCLNNESQYLILSRTYMLASAI